MSSVRDWDDSKAANWAEIDAQEFAKEMAECRIELMAKAAFEFDWPKDIGGWERLGPGHHQDRYKGMIRAALKAVGG